MECIINCYNLLIHQEWCCFVKHIFRKQNFVANYLASMSHDLPLGLHVLHWAPGVVIELLTDVRSLARPRMVVVQLSLLFGLQPPFNQKNKEHVIQPTAEKEAGWLVGWCKLAASQLQNIIAESHALCSIHAKLIPISELTDTRFHKCKGIANMRHCSEK